MRKIPYSTYRVQLNSEFTFSDLEATVPYFKKLGVSHLFLSPIMEAAKGSTHFYDTFDYTSISEVLGGDKGLESLAERCSASGIGLILDIVPNHMTVLNRFMIDYLRKGKKSFLRELFDVDLDSPESRRKIIFPLLDFYPFQEPDRLQIVGDSIMVDNDKMKFPILSGSWNKRKATATLIGEQLYILTYWKEAFRLVNYRRFFAVNDLIAIRIEKKKNFDSFHAKVNQLISKGMIHGLRIDHIDGLYDPVTYLRRLHKIAGDLPVWVEKILARDEILQEDWQVEGDTGYSARARINSVFIDGNNLNRIRKLFRRYGGDSYEGEKYRVFLKTETSKTLFLSDLKKYSRLIQGRFTASGIHGVSVEAISDALNATIACMDQYRTYSKINRVETRKWKKATKRAMKYFPPLSRELSCINFFIDLASVDTKSLLILKRIEQFTGAVMAKSMEDCYFYRYTALLSTCIVGFMPFEDRYEDIEVHNFFSNLQRSGKKPMITLSTHDTKFGEDAIARFNTLSDMIGDWECLLKSFSVKSEIKEYDKYRILQVILGTFYNYDEEYIERLRSYITKALRESRENTNWEYPSAKYEQLCLEFANKSVDILEKEWNGLISKIQYLGGLNSLSQTVIKFMAPGVPDTYQGSESLNLSFVDPDNRRPVDFKSISERLENIYSTMPALNLENICSGDLKLWITSKLLSIRSGFYSYFMNGSYNPLEFEGINSGSLFGFSYSLGDRIMLIIVSRHHQSILNGFSYEPECWKGTKLRGLAQPVQNVKNLITGMQANTIDLAEIMSEYPFAVVEVS
ncbi:MAG: malto-oligosyltrehalose synthase [Candidatus Thermoplasmatota archaeon]|nr:malto-oligosyltrehalose synthase [Candidatus Thermoplasmatota archaeon]